MRQATNTFIMKNILASVSMTLLALSFVALVVMAV